MHFFVFTTRTVCLSHLGSGDSSTSIILQLWCFLLYGYLYLLLFHFPGDPWELRYVAGRILCICSQFRDRSTNVLPSRSKWSVNHKVRNPIGTGGCFTVHAPLRLHGKCLEFDKPLSRLYVTYQHVPLSDVHLGSAWPCIRQQTCHVIAKNMVAVEQNSQVRHTINKWPPVLKMRSLPIRRVIKSWCLLPSTVYFMSLG